MTRLVADHILSRRYLVVHWTVNAIILIQQLDHFLLSKHEQSMVLSQALAQLYLNSDERSLFFLVKQIRVNPSHSWTQRKAHAERWNPSERSHLIVHSWWRILRFDSHNARFDFGRWTEVILTDLDSTAKCILSIRGSSSEPSSDDPHVPIVEYWPIDDSRASRPV